MSPKVEVTQLMKVCGVDVQVAGRLIRIARLEGERYEALADPEAVLEALRESPARIDLFTFMQNMPHTTPEYHYPMEWDNLAVLPVTTFEHWWARQINNKIRNMLRRAERSGVVVREVPFDEALVRGVSAVYNEVPIRRGRRFPHYGKDLDSVRRMSGTFLEQSTFIGAFLGESLIGFIKLVGDKNRQQASLMHVLSMLQHRDKAPTNALIAQAVRSCAGRGIPCLVYGSFSYGRKQRDGLSDFKKQNGFERVDLPRYYVPLTRVGGAALRLRLHRGLAYHVPETVQSRLRSIRARWYTRAAIPGRRVQATPVKPHVQALLKRVGLYQRLKASCVYDWYWGISDRRVIARRDRQVEFYRGLLQGFRKGELIFDIGANHGSKTDVFLRLSARVVAVDPDEHNQEILRQKFLSYRLNRKPLVIVAKAVSDMHSVATMWIDSPGSAKNTLSEKWVAVLRSDGERFGGRLDFPSKKDVHTITLDQLISQYGAPYYVKIDVEGLEPRVLRGLHRRVPYLSFEVNLPEFRLEGLDCVELLNHLASDGQFNYTADLQDGLVLERWVDAKQFADVLNACSEDSIEVFWRTPLPITKAGTVTSTQGPAQSTRLID
jgi:FkbM family methyltransferase